MCADRVTPLREPDWGASASMLHLVNHEAEQALLGAILVNNKAYDAVCDTVAFDDFGHPMHGEIYAAIGSLIAGGSVADPITLAAFFAAADTFLAKGGSSYLALLARSAVTVINATHYARTIRDLARRRQLVEAAQQIVNDAALPQPDRGVERVLDDSEQLLHDIAQNSIAGGKPEPLSLIMPRTIKTIEAAYQRAGSGGGSGGIVVDTGIASVDKIIRGMGAGDLVVLAGRPAMGKTAAAGTIAVNAAGSGKAVAFFSLEMTAQQLSMRWIAGRTGISTDKQRHGDLDQMVDWPMVFEANQHISRLPIYIDDQPRLGVGQIRQRARRLKRRRLDLVCIDHLQLMRQVGRQETRRVEIGDITSSLKAMAKELEVPILLVSQLNRALENRDDKRPTMADLKESGDIEQDADIIVFVHREAYYLDRAGAPTKRPKQTEEAFASELNDWHERCDAAKGKANLIIAKNRQGATGFAPCAFDADRQRFETLMKWEKAP